MGRIVSFQCDRCPSVKGEANRWWMVEMQPVIATNKVEKRAEYPLLTLEPFDVQRLTPTKRILCGQECVAKEISEFMGGVYAENKVAAAS